MSDKDSLPGAGIPFFSIVDENGVSTDGTSASMSLIRSRGMEPICEVSSAGVATSGSTLATLRQRGIPFYCPVTENGVTSDAVTMTTLRYRGIPFFCPVGTDGVATSGTATIGQLAGRGIPYACILDALGGAGTPVVVVPAAPDLTWNSLETDDEPDFLVDLPDGNDDIIEDAAEGDHLIIEYQLQAGGAWTEYVDRTLSAGDITDDTITITGVGAVSNGSYYFRARLERGALIGTNSANEAVTINAATNRLMWSTDQQLWSTDHLTWV